MIVDKLEAGRLINGLVAEIDLLRGDRVLLQTELECWAGWVSINLTGGTFHESISQTFHRGAEG